MAVTEQVQTRMRPRWHLVVRLAGLTGLLIAAAGLVFVAAGAKQIGWIVTAAGAVLAFVGIVAEMRQGIGLVTGRRGAFGSNVALQVALAALLLVGVNLFSFSHYWRFDWTRDRYFTLSNEVRDQMSRLRG